ncbi:MAG: hypothetical protein M1839_003747 [Geoglossum umbratile]|nr:MAG: hypothetical protein M1839_003747 [Geoglossum umbratile]
MVRLFETDLWRSFVTGVQVDDGDSGPRLRGFLASTHPLRYSSTHNESGTAGYFSGFPNSLTSELPGTAPPAYDASSYQGRIPPPMRFNVLPREEEGRECLPAYSCSIRREAVFARKMEFRSPFDRACDRAWFKVFVILDGTMLKVCKVRTTAFAGKRASVHDIATNPDLPIAAGAGMVLKTYTLQYAEVGNAVDYKKRNYVIRLRIETDQFLLSCNTLETFLDWLEALSAAINLALPLEERSLPRFRTVPRYHIERPAVTRQQSASQESSVSDRSSSTLRRRADFRLERGRISRGAGRIPADVPLNESIEDERPPENLASEESIEGASPDESGTTVSSAPLSRRLSTSSTSAERPSSSPPLPDSPRCNRETGPDDGKWRPSNRWTMARDIRYAHRCTTALRRDGPRRNDLVIKDGKRWKIDWAEGRLVLQKDKPPQLPKYTEATNVGPRGERDAN